MRSIIFCIVVCSVSKGSCDAGRDLASLHTDFFAWRMEERPLAATSRGIHLYDDQIDSYDRANFDTSKVKADEYLLRLKAIPVSELSKVDLVSYKILNDMLSTYISGYEWRNYLNLSPINFMEGLQRNPASFVNIFPYNTVGDFENYIARLDKLPAMYEEFKVLMNEAIATGRTFHNHSMSRVDGQLSALLVDPQTSVFYQPFIDTLNKSRVDEKYRAGLMSRGLTEVSELITAYQSLRTYIQDVYLPNTRPEIGISSLDNGAAYYQSRIKWYLSVDMTPMEIHNIGLSEVERIVGNMQKIMTKQGFSGTVKEYFQDIMNDSSIYFATGDEMLDEFRYQIHTVTDPKLDKYFINLPNLPIEVRPTPNDGPIGSYSTGSADGSKPGIFWANVLRPESSPNLTMMALTLHEASPGHHLQLSYSITADTADFRQKMESSAHHKVPFAFPRYTAFVEGWALYAEFLGEEMGVYRTDTELIGRYSSEIFRACRLVVDTGIHALNWTRQEAVDYFLEYTARSVESVIVEVDRYITWPGQALAYKIGEMKIMELRKLAEGRLGDRFDLRKFHSIVLESGTLPLSVLDELVNDWLDSYAGVTEPPLTCASTDVLSSVYVTMGCVLAGIYYILQEFI